MAFSFEGSDLVPHPYDNIPSILKQRPNWVTWGVRDAPLKAPFNPDSLLLGIPSPAKAGIRDTWSDYQTAVECVAQGLAQGIGYEFDGSGDVYGVDLDHVISDDGLTPQAREIVSKLASYTEISPSRTGLHIFVLARGANISRHRKKDGFVEIYSAARYFTVTGNIYGNLQTIASRTAELQRIHDIYLLPEFERQVTTVTSAPMKSSTDNEYFLSVGLERDKVFAALWAGERRNGNESADDIALMNKLAYWCNANPDAMIHAFLSSPYCTQKDAAHVKKCRRSDYLPNTVRKACATVYSTAIADYERWQESQKRKRRTAR